MTLPPVTQECKDNRVPRDNMCSPILEERLGNELGACGEAPNPIKKGIVGSLYEQTYENAIPVALQSPAYEVLNSFQLSSAEVGQLFDYVAAYEDPREAVCDWVIDHFDVVQNFIPRMYPRRIQEQKPSLSSPLQVVSITLACIAILGVGFAAFGTYQHRYRTVIRYAQLDFLYMLLIGIGLVSFGSLFSALPSSMSWRTCGWIVWTTNLGYTFEMVPLIVKMAAIFRLMSAAERMERVVVTRRQLFGAVFGISFIMVVFLIVWTLVDPSQHMAEYQDIPREDGDEFVVEFSCYCGSSSKTWSYISVAIYLLLLWIATMQAFLTRKIRKEINESQILAIMIYSHCIFVSLRLVSLFLEDSLSRTNMMKVRSIIGSLDCLATVGIYFVPKFLAANAELKAEEEKVEDPLIESYRVTMTGQVDKQTSNISSPNFPSPSLVHESKSVEALRKRMVTLSAPPFPPPLDDSERHRPTTEASQTDNTSGDPSGDLELSGDLESEAASPEVETDTHSI